MEGGPFEHHNLGKATDEVQCKVFCSGENISKYTGKSDDPDKKCMDMWGKSPGRLENILRENDYTVTGIYIQMAGHTAHKHSISRVRVTNPARGAPRWGVAPLHPRTALPAHLLPRPSRMPKRPRRASTRSILTNKLFQTTRRPVRSLTVLSRLEGAPLLQSQQPRHRRTILAIVHGGLAETWRTDVLA
jgi:hypothetical protein